jgi:hypothetical protein
VISYEPRRILRAEALGVDIVMDEKARFLERFELAAQDLRSQTKEVNIRVKR